MKNNPTVRLSLRKFLLSALVAAPLAVLPAPLWALPDTDSDNVTSSSSATTFTELGNTLTITTPDRTVLKWVEFGSGGSPIADGEIVNYALPSSSAAVLNMVTGAGATVIGGDIVSNGRVLILNDNGITISSTAAIDTAGFVASTNDENEFVFLATGELSNFGTATTPVIVQDGATIDVGTSGNVMLFGSAATFAGDVTAGNLTITTETGGAITIGDATASSLRAVTLNSNGGAVNLSAGAGTVTYNGNLVVNSGGGAVSQGAGALVASNVNITSGAGAINLPVANASAAANTITFTVSGAATTINTATGRIAISGTTTGNLTLDGTTNITLNTLNITGNLDVASTAGPIASGGNTTVSGTVSLAVAAGQDITYSETGNVAFAALTAGAGSDISITSTTGDVELPALSVGSLIVTAADDITQTGALVISGSTTIDAASAATLTNVGNDFVTLVVKRGADDVTVVDLDDVTLGNGTATTGDLTVTTTGAFVFGTAANSTINLGGNLTVTTNGGDVTDLSDSIVASGSLTLNAGAGDVELDGNASATNPFTVTNRFGAINATAANVTVLEQTELNLGNITTTGDLVAYSGTAISNSGDLNIAGDTLVGAGTATAPGNISLDNDDNSLDVVRILTDLEVLGSSSLGVYLANNVVVATDDDDVTVAIPANIFGDGLAGNLTITTTGTGIIDNSGEELVVDGMVTLNSEAGITVTDGDNAFSNVTINSEAGAVSVFSTLDLTVNANLDGAAGAVAIDSDGDIILGSIDSDRTAGVTFSGADITDSVSGIRLFGDVTFDSDGDIEINNSGHSFGGVTITSAGDGDVTVVESGGLRLVNVTMGEGALTLTSLTGDILQNGASTGIIGGDDGATATFTASNGNITLTDADNAFDSRWSATASGDVSITNSNNTILGNITAGDALTVVGTVNDDDISQASGTSLNIFGETTFTVAADGNITVSNSGNRMGGLRLTSGTGDIDVQEGPTLNVRSVTTTGTLTLTSDNGDIIDTDDPIVAGAATFSAINGSVTLDVAGHNFSTVSFNTLGNATIVQGDAGEDITLGESTVGGALSVTNLDTGFDILQSGAITAVGNSSFLTDGGAVVLTNSANRFGAIRFIAGQASAITESSSLNLMAGSIATAPVVLITNGDFVTSGTGASSFLSDLTIQATGTITPGAGSLLVIGDFTVFSNNTKDLSALSLSGNLAGNDPINLGTGTYIEPAD